MVNFTDEQKRRMLVAAIEIVDKTHPHVGLSLEELMADGELKEALELCEAIASAAYHIYARDTVTSDHSGLIEINDYEYDCLEPNKQYQLLLVETDGNAS